MARRSRQPLVRNPAWTTAAVVSAWDLIKDSVNPAWLPLLDDVNIAREDRVSGHVQEYGCGAHGCVFPTHETSVVLKVTTDATEVEFAQNIAPHLVSPITVIYHTVISLNQVRQGHRVYLLWRESAYKVGEMERVLGAGAAALINAQHNVAKAAYSAMHHYDNSKRRGRDKNADIFLQRVRMLLSSWLDECARMVDQGKYPQLRALGHGFIVCFEQQRVFFGDVHDGNVGLVHRADGGHWVVTDPGHTTIVPPEFDVD